ncbi:MAG: hypothetical protein A2X76_09085 [Lysobacterales bacterium GWF1_69_6]|nr:MAG: hypothetical protein A2X76_09085 [Xanthomonadales bacterium GWF1_69_6]
MTLDPATGAITVAPGTPAGTYTVTYQLCEQLNPTNCDTATVSVTVDAAVIDAVDDTGTVASGAAGGTALPNVLANDALDGNRPTLASVSLRQVSSTDPNVSLDPATGAIHVAPGTPSGRYGVTYEICEPLNPGNCDLAEVVVRVRAASIEAVDDAGAVASGASGGIGIADVLANDTLGASPATLATVTLSQVWTANPNVTLDPATGAVHVAPGTPAGSHTVAYRICEQLNPANCSTARAVVVVSAPILGVLDDEATTPQDQPVDVAVLGNDSLDGSKAEPGTVVVTIISGPSNGSASVGADGVIHYVPSQYYSGTDELRYRVCSLADPNACAEAVVRLVVAPNVVEAPDQAFNADQASPVVVPLYSVSASSGAPLDPASVQVTAPPAHGTVVVNADGSATYTPDPSFHGSDAFEYRVCDQSVPTPVCDTGRVVVTIEMAVPELRLSKSTPATTVRIGDYVRYEVVVENTGIAPATGVTVVDVPPAGFTYVEGTLAVQDADGVHGLAGTGPLRITGIDIPVGGRAVIGYLLRVGAGVGPGEHTNVVSAIDATGSAVGNTAKIGVTLEGDPMLEESLVLGTVFLDANGDGRQQPGEPGLAGVRLATVEGLVVETDVRGRFHLAGLAGGNPLRGRNAILKVDVATLPPGSRFTTPNPLVRRITPGIPVRFDFGVQLPADGDAMTPELR